MSSGGFVKKHPFISFGLPFLSAMLAGTFFLAEIRTSRYAPIGRNARVEVVEVEKRSLKSLKEELEEFEARAAIKTDYEMKPVLADLKRNSKF